MIRLILFLNLAFANTIIFDSGKTITTKEAETYIQNSGFYLCIFDKKNKSKNDIGIADARTYQSRTQTVCRSLENVYAFVKQEELLNSGYKTATCKPYSIMGPQFGVKCSGSK